MTDDDIWSKISEGNKKEDFMPFVHKNIIPLVIYTGEVIGLVIFDRCDGEAFIHPMVLKQYRRKYAREAIEKAVMWFLDNFDEPLKCEIPNSHKSTINFAKKTGFIPEAIENDKTVMNYGRCSSL